MQIIVFFFVVIHLGSANENLDLTKLEQRIASLEAAIENVQKISSQMQEVVDHLRIESTPKNEIANITAMVEMLAANVVSFRAYKSDFEQLQRELQIMKRNVVSVEEYVSLVSVVNGLGEQLKLDIYRLNEQQQKDMASVMNQHEIDITEQLNSCRQEMIKAMTKAVESICTSVRLLNYVPGKKRQT